MLWLGCVWFAQDLVSTAPRVSSCSFEEHPQFPSTCHRWVWWRRTSQLPPGQNAQAAQMGIWSKSANQSSSRQFQLESRETKPPLHRDPKLGRWNPEALYRQPFSPPSPAFSVFLTLLKRRTPLQNKIIHTVERRWRHGLAELWWTQDPLSSMRWYISCASSRWSWFLSLANKSPDSSGSYMVSGIRDICVDAGRPITSCLT